MKVGTKSVREEIIVALIKGIFIRNGRIDLHTHLEFLWTVRYIFDKYKIGAEVHVCYEDT